MRDYSPHDTRRATQAFLFDSYWGGERYRYPSLTTLTDAQLRWNTIDESGNQSTRTERFVSYLVPHPAESDESFRARLALASYVNPCELIVDAYAEGVTCDVQRQLGQLEESLSTDVDFRGNAWGGFAEDVARWTCVYGETYTLVDAPSGSTARNRADESAAGLKPYCVLVHPTSVAWRVADEYGRLTELAWADEAYAPDDPMSLTRTVRVRVWSHEGWEIREATVSQGVDLSTQRGAFKRLDGGKLPAALGGQLPIVPNFYRRDSASRLPRGESLIATAADLARSIYNKRSWGDQIAREAGFPTLAVPTGSSVGGKLPPQTRLTIGTSKAIGYSADAGAPVWIQPESTWSERLRAECFEDFQFALRSAGLELAADASSQVQSGEALRIRSRDFESRAKRFARNMQRWETATLSLYAKLAGVREEPSITYPRRFTLPDLSADLTRALTLLKESPIEIGKTAKVEAVMQAVNAALTLSDEKQNVVREEIQQDFDADKAEINAGREVTKAEAAAKLRELRPPDQPAPPVSTEPVKPQPSESPTITAPVEQPKLFQYHLDSGVVTVNEARASLGLEPIEDGNIPVPEWQEKHGIGAAGGQPTAVQKIQTEVA